MNRNRFQIAGTWIWLLVVSGSFPLHGVSKDSVEFNRDIRPILSTHCFRCHGPDPSVRKAGLRLDREEGLFGERKGGAPIVKFKPRSCQVLKRVETKVKTDAMPPSETHDRLKPAEIELIRNWVNEGAPFQQQWSFVAPIRPCLPAVKDKSWARNPIDSFILGELESKKINPAHEADRSTLIRRVSFDLTGLPPSADEVEAFLNDRSLDAYEKVVERLLASPRYGEHRARYWLDAARYADTHGLHFDNYREIWGFRDWVIQAFNRNKPFDRFTTEQIAGDLLPDATLDQVVASGFHRCTASTTEGGTIEAEDLANYARDRVETTAWVWLGLTANCAVCHDHKFDPITMKDFYSFSAFFRNTTQNHWDGNTSAPAPAVLVPGPGIDFERWALLSRQLVVEKKAAGLTTRQRPREAKASAGTNAPLALINAPVPANLSESNPPILANAPVPVIAYVPANILGAANVAGRPVIANPPPENRTSLTSQVQAPSLPPVFTGKPVAVLLQTPRPLLFPSVVGLPTGSPPGPPHFTSAARFEVRPLIANPRPQDRPVVTPASAAPRPPVFTGRPVAVLWQNPRTALYLPVESLPPRIPPEPEPPKCGEEREDSPPVSSESAPAERVSSIETELRAMGRTMTSTLVQSERRDSIPMAFILDRGQYDKPGEKVFPATFKSLPPMPTDAPRNRLGLAQWLVAENNPLTARVTVNRLWQEVFGRGIVATPEDFGVMGAPPSHPKLLDWLAVEFRESGWDVKHMMRLMVTSATYRQSAIITPEKYQADPENRMLSRGPRFRLDAESIRDNALAVGGLLSSRIGGPSVKPYQPGGIWNSVSIALSDTFNYTQDHGESLYRRSLYTFWKRKAPPVSLAIYDAPTREVCILRRERTITPMQALVTLNDPQFVEAARQLATGALTLGGDTVQRRLDWMSLRLIARRFKPEELVEVEDSLRQLEAFYASHEADARRVVAIGESSVIEKIQVKNLAAWTVLANELLNLDEVFNK